MDRYAQHIISVFDDAFKLTQQFHNNRHFEIIPFYFVMFINRLDETLVIFIMIALKSCLAFDFLDHDLLNLWQKLKYIFEYHYSHLHLVLPLNQFNQFFHEEIHSNWNNDRDNNFGNGN